MLAFKEIMLYIFQCQVLYKHQFIRFPNSIPRENGNHVRKKETNDQESHTTYSRLLHSPYKFKKH